MPSSSAAPATEQLALATAARLAHALDPDGWARCRSVCPPRHFDGGAQRFCVRHRWHRERCNDGLAYIGEWMPDGPPLPPTLAEAQAEWAAAGGEPERGPALSGRSEDGRVEWRVKVSGGGDTGLRAMLVVRIQVGSAAYVRFGNETWVPEGRAPLADWRECVRLAEAADGGAK